MDSEYQEQVDIRGFCKRLGDAWKCVPDTRFHEMLEIVFNGYDLEEVTNDEMVELLDEFIHQNQ